VKFEICKLSLGPYDIHDLSYLTRAHQVDPWLQHEGNRLAIHQDVPGRLPKAELVGFGILPDKLPAVYADRGELDGAGNADLIRGERFHLLAGSKVREEQEEKSGDRRTGTKPHGWKRAESYLMR
jgi:hypothetical protein